MYDTIIIGAGMSGLAAGIRLALLRPAGLHSRAALHDRRAELVLSPPRPRLRRRPARGHQLHAQGHQDRPARPAAAAAAAVVGRLRARRRRSARRSPFPACGCEFDNDSSCCATKSPARFPRRSTTSSGWSRRSSTTTTSSEPHADVSARAVVSEIITEPLLVEMLFCPLMFYGSAREHDMDWGQFSIMFRSIFLEGLRPARRRRAADPQAPRAQVPRARRRAASCAAGVQRLARRGRPRAPASCWTTASELEGRNVLSSAGWCETMRLCDDGQPRRSRRAGPAYRSARRSPRSTPAAASSATTARSRSSTTRASSTGRSRDELCDVRSGVICSPEQFRLRRSRSTTTARCGSRRWPTSTAGARSTRTRTGWKSCAGTTAITESAVRFVPDYRGRVIDTDMFTPTTIVRFTGHDNGAVYGAPDKQLDGRTHLEEPVHLRHRPGLRRHHRRITSGIAMANRHCLQA